MNRDCGPGDQYTATSCELYAEVDTGHGDECKRGIMRSPSTFVGHRLPSVGLGFFVSHYYMNGGTAIHMQAAQQGGSIPTTIAPCCSTGATESLLVWLLRMSSLVRLLKHAWTAHPVQHNLHDWRGSLRMVLILCEAMWWQFYPLAIGLYPGDWLQPCIRPGHRDTSIRAIHPTSGFDIGNDLQFKNLSGDSMTWIANVTAGTQLVAILTDLGSATGANAQSQPFIVGQGPNNSCLDSSSGSSTTTSAVSTASSAQSSDNARAPPTNTSAHTATSVASPNTSRSHPSTTAVSPSSGVPNPSGSSDTHSTSISSSSGLPSRPSNFTIQSGTHTPPGTGVPASPSAANANNKSTFNPGVTVGIAIVSLLVFSGVALILLIFWRRMRRKRAGPVISPHSDLDTHGDAQLFLPHRPQLPSIPSTKSTSTPHMLSPATSSGRSLHSASSAFGTSGTSHSTLMSEYDALIALAGIVESPSSPSVAPSAREPIPSSPLTADVTGSAPSIDSRRSRRRARVIREARYEADGGVRLAGGPIGAALEEEEVMSEARTSILPPPYHLVYGD
ncbi:hypothetical protein ONZ51_g12597 [Trametes cubensis]|uniref:Uncharacterized protein n=1 Tax=Trametes cubensis TaxID=1111947 RepID=A0AAD7TFW6_9APHY|nr:hypothetical protein ONZ51_g12597 [Trametes cubensis]